MLEITVLERSFSAFGQTKHWFVSEKDCLGSERLLQSNSTVIVKVGFLRSRLMFVFKASKEKGIKNICVRERVRVFVVVFLKDRLVNAHKSDSKEGKGIDGKGNGN